MRLLTLLALSCLGLPALGAPELPRAWLDTAYAPPAGALVGVPPGGDLQAAIDLARPGDTLVLQAGATYTGPIRLPDKGASTQWIYIRSTAYSSLPAPGNRVSPADAPNMAVIVGTGSPVVAIQTAARAHHYRFVGIEFRPAAGSFTTGLVRLGDGETDPAQIPRDIVFDRCYIHGDATLGGRRGIALNSASTAVIDSYLSDWKEAGSDSQAIAGWTGPGPYRIVNNYLEAAGENLMFGGADPAVTGLSPADIEIRGNRFTKQVAWRSQSWTVKNLFELKHARRTLVEGNVFENDWEAAQNFAINIKSSNQDGTAPWSVTDDLTFRHNIVQHGPSAIKFCGLSCDGAQTAQGRSYLVQNNLFDDINSATWGGSGTFLQTIGVTPGLTVNHNTVIHDGPTFSGGDGGERANTGLEFTDNVVQRGHAGFKGSGQSEGLATLAAYFPRAVFARNVIVGGNALLYPLDNAFPASYDAVGFVNRGQGDYRLSTSSPYRNTAADGTAAGADFAAVNAATSCALSGQCGSPRAAPAPVNAFAFTDQTNVTPGALVTSNTVTISGPDPARPVTISVAGGGAYSIGCTTRFVTTTSMIRPGQTVCVRYVAPPAPGATTSTTLTVEGVSATFRTTTAAAVPATLPNETSLWWIPEESGWGINFAQQGETLFATLFTYDSERRPLWLVMPAGRFQAITLDDFDARQADLGAFVGPLYRTTGPPFYSQPFNPIGPANLTEVGEMRVAFGTSGTTLDYSFGPSRVRKSIRRQVFGTRAANCRAATGSRALSSNYQDLWWNPAESGWGLNITQQGDVLFATLFSYAADGTGLWLVMSGGIRQSDGSYLGDLYRTSGPAFDSQPFTPISDVRRVGTMRLRFSDGENATLTYSVDNVNVTRTITRQVFGSPLADCVS